MKQFFIITLFLSGFLFVGCSNSKTTKDPKSNQTTEQEAQASKKDKVSEESSSAPKTFKSAKVKPSNDFKKVPELKAFLEDLIITLENKDVEGLLQVVANDIKIGFGAEAGIEDFKTMWELDQDAANSKIWKTLKNIVELGGTFDGNNRSIYTTPYIHTKFPDAYDPFVYSVITGKNVNVRTFPNRNATTIRQLHNDIVIELHEGEDKIVNEKIGNETYPWVKIRMSDGEEGYIFGKYVHSPIGFRAVFEKLPKEGWKLYVLVAGD